MRRAAVHLHGAVAQLWQIMPTNSGYFQLRVAASGQCMTVTNASQANAARISQQPCTGAFNQQWTTVPSGVPGWPTWWRAIAASS